MSDIIHNAAELAVKTLYSDAEPDVVNSKLIQFSIILDTWADVKMPLDVQSLAALAMAGYTPNDIKPTEIPAVRDLFFPSTADHMNVVVYSE